MKKVKRYQIFSLICGLFLLMGCLSNAITVKAQETDAVAEEIAQTVSGNDAAVISEEATTDEYTYTDSNQNIFTYVVDTEGNATITSITATGSAITVPDVIDDKTVISVGNNNECVITNPSMVIPELTINCPSIGVLDMDSVGSFAFAGENIHIGKLYIKYRLENHPNYKYTAEADKSYLSPNPYLLEYSDEEIEQVRVKAVGEEGYIEPRIIESARRRAKEQEKKRKAKEAMEAAKALEKMTVKPGDETKTKEQLKRDMKSREQLPKEESSEVLAKYKISQMQILDSYSPMYEFED